MARSRVRSRLPVLGLLLGGLSLLLLAGCGTFVGRQYVNFTAYYNKFYNAGRAFEKGVEAIREEEWPVDRTRYIPVFRRGGGQSGAASSFEEAIQKSADVLRDNPDSRWVDDALLLIGKSYYYQGNYVGAAQKFREVLALAEGRKEEARFWLARTLVANGRRTAAQDVLRPVTEAAGPPKNEWRARMLLVQGTLSVQQEQWSAAAAALSRGLQGDLPDEPAARGAFLMGQVRETTDQPRAARAAYRQAYDYGPSYQVDFAARLSDIELQGRHGTPEAALERLDDLQTDDKNLEKRGAMALVEARIHRAQGRERRAAAVLRRALYQTREPPLSEGATGRLHYDLATLYRDTYKDFSRAAAHFDTAGTQLSPPRGAQPADDQRMPTAPLDARAQADQYRTLAERSREVSRLDSLLRIGRMPPSEYRAFVAELRRERAAAQEAAAERQAAASRRLQTRRPSAQQSGAGAASASAATTPDSDASFLFHQDPARVQQGRQQFVATWGDRPRVDNWRRRDAMQNVEAASGEDPPDDGEGGPPSEPAPEQTAAATAGLDLSAVPRDSASQAEMTAERAVARYELGNALFLAAARPDSAATWYRRVLQEDGDQPVARRALYALAEAYRAQGDSAAARQAYRRLLDRDPPPALATRARERLGRAAPQRRSNRIARADSAYARAYDVWQREGGAPGLDRLLSVAADYPETDAAPRALLASSIIYWRRLQADSASAPRARVEAYLSTLRRDSIGAPSTPPADSSAAGRSPPETDPAPRPAPADSGTTAASAARPDTTASPARAPLSAMLGHLTERYPDAPQVARARTIRDLLERSAEAPDSAAPVGPRRPAADSARRPAADSARRSPADSARTAGASRPASDRARPSASGDALPAPTAPTQGAAPEADTAAAPWTLVVDRLPSADGAPDRVQRLRTQVNDEWPVRVVADSSRRPVQHLLIVGRFADRAAAIEARRQLRTRLQGPLRVRRHPAADARR